MNERQGAFRRCAAAVCTGVLLLFASAAPVQAAGEQTETAPRRTVTELVPVGRAVGVKLFSDGVLVVGLSDGHSAAKDSGLREGDIMLTFNGTEIESTEQLQQLIAENGEAKASMGVRRGGAVLTMAVEPREDEDGVCRLGAWIRDSMAGIGTMTFYDPESGVFGALGHGVTDVDTGELMPLSSGSIMNASVKAVRRGESGSVGELRGDFDLDHDCGSLYANTECGIFGTLDAQDAAYVSGKALPVARRGEVHCGNATVLVNCSGTEVEEYAIEIERLYDDSAPSRNLLLRVTDERLLEKTGGIVPGMSGSVILQDGKIVGAVTHVLLHQPARGYGILIENMLDAAGLA